MRARHLFAAAGLAGALILSGCGSGSDGDSPPTGGGGGEQSAPEETPAFPREQITTEIQAMLQEVYDKPNPLEEVCQRHVDVDRMANGDLIKCRAWISTEEGLAGIGRVPNSKVQVDPVGVYETSNPAIVAVMSESVTAIDEDAEVWPTNSDPLSVWFFTKESGEWKFAGSNLEGDTEAIPGES